MSHEIELPADPQAEPEEFGLPGDVDQSEALAFWLSHRHCVIVWRDGPQRLRPGDPAKRIRDLRPGDAVVWENELREVLAMSVYR